MPAGLLHQLMAVDFALHEWALYLDTHPRDARAKGAAARLRELREKLLCQYQMAHGPLTAGEDPGEAWLESPWPWQKEFMESRCR